MLDGVPIWNELDWVREAPYILFGELKLLEGGCVRHLLVLLLGWLKLVLLLGWLKLVLLLGWLKLVLLLGWLKLGSVQNW